MSLTVDGRPGVQPAIRPSRGLFAVKPLDTILAEGQETGEHTLKRTLGPVNLVSLGIGAIIGAGIFVLTGQAAAQHAGPAVVLCFVLAGLGCAFAGLCYAEFASLIPVAGSAYTYGYATLGEIIAWIIGWDLILEYAFGAATVASGWSGYFNSFLQDFGIYIPPQFTATPGTDLVFYASRWHHVANIAPVLQQAGVDPATLPQATGIFNAIAFVAILLVTSILVLGVKESANLNSAVVVIKVSIVLMFIGLGTIFVLRHGELALDNWTPFIPANTGKFGHFGWSGIARGAAVVFFAYIGFDAVSTTAQEAKNPQKDMPFGILGSLAICTLLYIGVAGLLTGIVPFRQLNVADPVAVGIDAMGYGGSIFGVPFASFVVKLGAVTGLATVMLVMLLGQSRVFYAMSRDRLLPAWAGKVHPRFRTPYVSSIVVGLAVALFASLVPMGELAHLVSIGTLFAFAIVSAGVLVLRYKRPHLPRSFRTPLVPLVPILGIVVSLGLMAALPLVTWERLIIWLNVGFLVYFGYSIRRSRVQREAGMNAPRSRAQHLLGLAGSLALALGALLPLYSGSAGPESFIERELWLGIIVLGFAANGLLITLTRQYQALAIVGSASVLLVILLKTLLHDRLPSIAGPEAPSAWAWLALFAGSLLLLAAGVPSHRREAQRP